jgi:hypothetical protein
MRSASPGGWLVAGNLGGVLKKAIIRLAAQLLELKLSIDFIVVLWAIPVLEPQDGQLRYA